MVTATSHLSQRAQHLIKTFQAAFAALDDFKSDERSFIYEQIVRHVRSAQPMALLGAADVIEPLAQATVALADGVRIELTAADGVRALLVVDSAGNDLAVPLGLREGESLVAAVRSVQP